MPCGYPRAAEIEFDPWVEKDPQREEITTHSSVLAAWEIPWIESSQPG